MLIYDSQFLLTFRIEEVIIRVYLTCIILLQILKQLKVTTSYLSKKSNNILLKNNN